MDAFKLNVKFLLAGLILGVVLVERWRRYGIRNATVADSVLVVEAVPATKPKTSALIAKGAKADAVRAKRFLGKTAESPPEKVG
jgi:predicted negative regulator of RcsB-dependent stress response